MLYKYGVIFLTKYYFIIQIIFEEMALGFISYRWTVPGHMNMSYRWVTTHGEVFVEI